MISSIVARRAGVRNFVRIDHAIPIEFLARDKFVDVGHVSQGNFRCVGFAKAFQDVLCRGQHILAFVIAVVDVSQRQPVRTA